MNKVLGHYDNNPVRDLEAYAILASAQWDLKQTSEARHSLTQATQIAETKLNRADSGDLSSGWIDWIIGHVLLREVQYRIESTPIAIAEQPL